MKHRIAAIPDDGIGKEVVPEDRRVLDAASSSSQRPRLRAPARLQHHAQDAVDAEPGVPETRVSVAHRPLDPRGSTAFSPVQQPAVSSAIRGAPAGSS